jgi:DNA-binding Xre family transcriptional regulator
MQAVGIGWQRVIVAKLESGRRSFVRVDELLALCLVLEISVVDLLVPKDVDDDRYYRVVPNGSARAVDVREWVRGEGLLFWRPYPEPEVDNSTPFASPTGKTSDPTLWMPGDRADRVAKRYEWDPEEADQ